MANSSSHRARPDLPDDLAPLDAQEERAWRALTRLLTVLPRALDDDMQQSTGMNLTNYVVLVALSEAPGQTLRMSDLADRTAVSPSRMTRVVSLLEQNGLVQRSPSPDDGRSFLARLTPAGLARLEVAWPAHLASVRHHVFDHVQHRDLVKLADLARTLIEAVEHGGERPGPE